jgi:hypothetical protein
MATVHLVSPELVKRTNDLLAKVKRSRGIDRALHDWVALMGTEHSRQPAGEPPPAIEPPAVDLSEAEASTVESSTVEPSTVADEPDTTDR